MFEFKLGKNVGIGEDIENLQNNNGKTFQHRSSVRTCCVQRRRWPVRSISWQNPG